MTSVDTVDLDWEPEVDDPDDFVRIDVYIVADSAGLYWSSGCWTADQSLASRYFSKKEGEAFASLNYNDGTYSPCKVIKL